MANELKGTRSQARKDYWSSISPEERSSRASNIAKTKWANMTTKERSAHGKMMINARNNKSSILIETE